MQTNYETQKTTAGTISSLVFHLHFWTPWRQVTLLGAMIGLGFSRFIRTFMRLGETNIGNNLKSKVSLDQKEIQGHFLRAIIYRTHIYINVKVCEQTQIVILWKPISPEHSLFKSMRAMNVRWLGIGITPAVCIVPSTPRARTAAW